MGDFSRQTRRLAAALALAAIVVATMAVFVPSAATADVDPAVEQAIADARANVIRCQAALDAGGLTAAERAEATRCVHINEAALRRLAPAPTPSPTSTAVPTPPPSTTPAPTTPPPSTVPPTTPAAGFPNASNTGVPQGWQPASTRSTDLRVTTAGATVEDVRLTNGADILVDAPGVTIRRVELLGGRIDLSPGSACNRTRIEQVTIRRPAGTVTDADQEGRITPGGWSVDRLHLDGVPEGLRAGGKAQCGDNAISNSFLRIQAPDVCADWHGDGIQGYDGGPVTVRNVTIDFQERGGCGGTAPFFYPHSQGNTSVDVDGLIVSGGGFAFRNGMPGRVVGLKVVDGSWGYGPIDVRCSALAEWSAQVVTVDSAWQPTTVRTQPCSTEGGG